MTKPVLYSGTKNASSWAMRAWLALKLADYDFEENVVDIRRPVREPNLDAIREFSPPGCVPVLDTGSAIIYDSLAIMEFANDVSGGVLLPPGLEQRARARSIAAWQHSGLSGICSQISFESAFYPDKRHLTDTEQTEARYLLAWLQKDLRRSGGPFVFARISLADIALVPCVIRLSAHDVDLSRLDEVSDWFEAVMNNRFVRDWLANARKLEPVYLADYREGEGEANADD